MLFNGVRVDMVLREVALFARVEARGLDHKLAVQLQASRGELERVPILVRRGPDLNGRESNEHFAKTS